MDVSVIADLSDIDAFFQDGEWEVQSGMIDVGAEAVEYAERNGTYQDHTFTLRLSNKYDVDEMSLTLYNDAESPKGFQYASTVESKGFDVLGAAALFAERQLKKRFEEEDDDNDD